MTWELKIFENLLGKLHSYGTRWALCQALSEKPLDPDQLLILEPGPQNFLRLIQKEFNLIDRLLPKFKSRNQTLIKATKVSWMHVILFLIDRSWKGKLNITWSIIEKKNQFCGENWIEQDTSAWQKLGRMSRQKHKENLLYLELLPFNWWTCESTFLKSILCWSLYQKKNKRSHKATLTNPEF